MVASKDAQVRINLRREDVRLRLSHGETWTQITLALGASKWAIRGDIDFLLAQPGSEQLALIVQHTREDNKKRHGEHVLAAQTASAFWQAKRATISARRAQVDSCLDKGLTYPEIAKALKLDAKTVREDVYALHGHPDGPLPSTQACEQCLSSFKPVRQGYRLHFCSRSCADIFYIQPGLKKTCTKCGQLKLLTEFCTDPRGTDRRSSHCSPCNTDYGKARLLRDPERERSITRAADKRRRRENPGKANAKARRLTRKIQDEVFSHYGAVCACCGTPYNLSIDHVNGGGTEHRKQFGSNNGFYYWLKRSGWPEGFQTLCLPCNTSKGRGSHCKLIHSNRHPTGLGWPSNDGKTCAGTPKRRGVNGTGSVSKQLRDEIVRLRSKIADLESVRS